MKWREFLVSLLILLAVAVGAASLDAHIESTAWLELGFMGAELVDASAIVRDASRWRIELVSFRKPRAAVYFGQNPAVGLANNDGSSERHIPELVYNPMWQQIQSQWPDDDFKMEFETNGLSFYTTSSNEILVVQAGTSRVVQYGKPSDRVTIVGIRLTESQVNELLDCADKKPRLLNALKKACSFSHLQPGGQIDLTTGDVHEAGWMWGVH